MKQNKKILIVEAASHPKVVENLFFLFKNHFKIDIFAIPDKYKNYSMLMPNVLKSGRLYTSIHSTLIFLQLIFLGYKYDFIYISTGAETNHYSKVWTKPLFLICCILYNKKVILTIKNSNYYIPIKNNILNYISLKFVNLILFETRTMESYFNNYTKSFFNTEVVYDRYIDQLPQEYVNNENIISNKNIYKNWFTRISK